MEKALKEENIVDDPSKSEGQLNQEIMKLREKLESTHKTIDAKTWQISQIQKEIEDIKKSQYGRRPKVLDSEEQESIRNKETTITQLKQDIKDLETKIKPDTERVVELFQLLEQK